MLAKIGQAAKRYSTDHSGESVPVADHHAVNAAMASTGLEISVAPGFTDEDTFDSMIVDLSAIRSFRQGPNMAVCGNRQKKKSFAQKGLGSDLALDQTWSRDKCPKNK